MFLRLHYSGHYEDKIVEITEEDWKYILALTKDRYLFDTEEGRTLLTILEGRTNVRTGIKTVVAYC